MKLACIQINNNIKYLLSLFYFMKFNNIIFPDTFIAV